MVIIIRIVAAYLLIVNVEEIFAVNGLDGSVGCCYATESPEIQEVAVDLGGNLTLQCIDPTTMMPIDDTRSVGWTQEGRDERPSRMKVGLDGELTLTDLERKDAGIYTCTVDETDMVIARVKVEVRTPPPALANVTVRPSTVLALLLWEVADTGGYPITHFTAHYREKEREPADHWHTVMPEHISPNVRNIDVYSLHPNTTYVFKIWATNQLGSGEATELEGTTLHDTGEIELARLLLKGAQTFDTRVWVAAVAVVMGTLLMLAIGTCYLLYKDCHIPSMRRDEQEVIELVPNIILNPGYYDDDVRTEHIEPDENSNDQTTTRMNNNTVIQPIRV